MDEKQIGTGVRPWNCRRYQRSSAHSLISLGNQKYLLRRTMAYSPNLIKESEAFKSSAAAIFGRWGLIERLSMKDFG